MKKKLIHRNVSLKILRNYRLISIFCLISMAFFSHTGAQSLISLHEAAEKNNITEMQRLIARGVSINEKEPRAGLTPLMIAAWYNHSEAVQLLLKSGADINIKSNDGIVNNIPYYGEKALFYAAGNNDSFEAMQLLVKAGADIHERNGLGNTLLMAAAMNNSQRVAKWLVKSGVDIHAKNNYGHTALLYAVTGGNKSPAMIKILVEAGANINEKNEYGQTVLMFASSANDVESVQTLISLGADTNLRDNIGRTALDIAEERRATDAARILRLAQTSTAEQLVEIFKSITTDVASILRQGESSPSEKPAYTNGSDSSKSTSNSSTGASNGSPSRTIVRTKVTCRICNGTGLGEKYTPPAYNGKVYESDTRCPYCSDRSIHRHLSCTRCHGKGYIEQTEVKSD